MQQLQTQKRERAVHTAPAKTWASRAYSTCKHERENFKARKLRRTVYTTLVNGATSTCSYDCTKGLINF